MLHWSCDICIHYRRVINSELLYVHIEYLFLGALASHFSLVILFQRNCIYAANDIWSFACCVAMVGGSKIIASGDMCRRQWKPVIATAKQFSLADQFTQSMFLYTDLG